MNEIITTVVPVFALIVLGYGASRSGHVSEAGAKALSSFAFMYATPALLFRTMVNVNITDVSPWRIWGAFFSAAAIVWLLATLVSRRVNSLAPANGASAAIGASFGNLVMLGLPLVLSYYGRKAALPAALLIMVHAPVQWFFATVQAEFFGGQAKRGLVAMVADLCLTLLKNPIVAAIIIGTIWRALGLGLAPVADRTISLLAQAAIPASLFALGLSLASYGLKGQLPGVFVLMVLKMALFPVLALVLATGVFELDDISTKVVVLFAALPTGANAFLFAARYKAAIAPVSGAIALGTALSIATISLLLWLQG